MHSAAHTQDVLSSQRYFLLSLRRLPGRLTSEQTAVLLGVSPADITILMAAKFLVPLGRNLAANSPKYFSSAQIEQLMGDPEVMGQMQTALTKHWRQRNCGRQAKTVVSRRNTLQAA